MALTVEDGSIVDNANSYNSRAALIEYAAARGVVLADTDATDVFAIKAMDYLAMYDAQWRGELVDPDVQLLAWPRKGVLLDGAWTELSSAIVPTQLVRAQLELAIQASKGINLVPTSDPSAAFIKREKVDVIETEYSEAVALDARGRLPEFPLVASLIKPLLKAVPLLRTRRV
jgi:hypothetical protein